MHDCAIIMNLCAVFFDHIIIIMFLIITFSVLIKGIIQTAINIALFYYILLQIKNIIEEIYN